MKFDKAKNAVKTCLVICMLLCLVSVICTSLNPQLSFIATIVSMLFFFLSFAIALLYCKCSHCGKRILLGMFKLQRCPKCQYDLVTGEKYTKGNKKKH